MENDMINIGMMPSHPGVFVREEVIDALDLSITKAAEVLKVRRATLNDLLNGKSDLSPEMALRLEKAFDLSMDTLLRMQAWHSAQAMRAKAADIKVERYAET